MSADAIDDAVAGLGGLPGAVVGRGPRHPYEPEAAPAGEIAEFLGAHPVLARDPGYVAFLERYAHACVKDDAETMIIDLLGFGDAETHMNELDGCRAPSAQHAAPPRGQHLGAVRPRLHHLAARLVAAGGRLGRP